MTPSYKNGYIPSSLLVTFATGTNADGYWEHQLSPATLAKHRALVARASRRGALRLTPGWSCYRPYYWQEVAQRLYGNGAAKPGTSSHGGFWEGRQTLAMDYHNWSTLYGGDQAAWFADCRAVGLTPGMIMRSRGYPDEPWHVIDLDPWAPAPAGIGAEPFGGFLMALSDAQQQQMYNALVAGNGAYGMPEAIVNVLRSEIAPAIVAIAMGGIFYPGTNWNAFQTLTNVVREDDGREMPTVDEGEIAEKLAPILAPMVAANLGKLSDETVEAIATAAADERDRRERERLNA